VLKATKKVSVAATDEQDHAIAITQCPEVVLEGLRAITHGLCAITHGLQALAEDVQALESNMAAVNSRLTEVQAKVAKLTAQAVRNEQALMLAQVLTSWMTLLQDMCSKIICTQHCLRLE
jgi:hypothetical protein